MNSYNDSTLNRYHVSVLNKDTYTFTGKCYIDAKNETEARVKAYRFGAVSHDQFDTCKAELWESSYNFRTGTPR